ncbi:hypothetical protein ACTFTM_23640 [Micromonospora sp. RB23]
MGGTDPGSAREEAERLVAALLAGARLASSGSGGGAFGPLGGMVAGVLGHSSAPGGGGRTAGGFATGSAECCVCPVCRGIAALRDPSPEFAERLATGAGDLAAGVASLLRAFAPPEPTATTVPEPSTSSQAAPPTSDDREAPRAAPTARSAEAVDEHVWRDATRTGHDSQPAPERDVWSVATRSADTSAPTTAAPVDDAGAVAAPVPTSRPVVPASRASDDTGADAPGGGA